MSRRDLRDAVVPSDEASSTVGLDHLVDVGAVVRRVVSARVADRHTVEDLTQETLVRLAGVDRRLTRDATVAYAIVTARNLVVNHGNSEAMRVRHQHRLVEYTTLDGPEQLTLEREETDALAAALETLDRQDRALLVRHEVDGVSTEVLAREAGVSKGAVAMRLARARATLRVEFVLAFRRVTLPTTRCRQILMAFSAGDGRRQHALGAADHLLVCPICAALARPVTERRRGIAVWLLIPVAEAVRRATRVVRDRRLAQTAMAVVATAAIVTGVLLVQRDDGERLTSAPATPTTAPTATSPSTVAVTTAPVATPSAPAAVATPSAPAAAAVPACPSPLPLDQMPSAATFGCPFAPSAITVIEVPGDEGFWARTATGAEVWVQLTGDGESPVDVQAGAALTITGTLADPAAIGPPASDPRPAAAGYVVQVAFADVATG